jgi:vacuolar-type H+-ATPase subunit F/Vma7
VSHRVQALCPPESAGGFALAGLPTAVAEEGEAAARLLELVARPELGVLLVDERLYAALPESVRRALQRRPLPMIVPFPAPLWEERPSAAEAYIVELLRQAIGYRVRLR